MDPEQKMDPPKGLENIGIWWVFQALRTERTAVRKNISAGVLIKARIKRSYAKLGVLELEGTSDPEEYGQHCRSSLRSYI